MQLFRGIRSLAMAVDLYGGELRSATSLRVAAVFIGLFFLSVESTDSFSSPSASPLWALETYADATLFALAGYTLASSRHRHSRRDFFSRRLRRAYPALLFSTLACFAVLGPIVSTSGIHGYFSDAAAWRFLLNLVAIPQLTLPGVFEFNALPDIVDAHLWAPLAFLSLVAFVTFASGSPWRGIILAGIVALLVVGPLGLDAAEALPGNRADPVRLMIAGPGLSATLSGFAGIAAAWWARRILLMRSLLATALAVMIGIALLGNEEWRGAPTFQIAIVLPATYAALYLATRKLPLPHVADRLYGPIAGLFFYTPPLQQLIASTAMGSGSGFINAGLAVPAALLVSFGSWWLVERRVTAAQRANHPAFATAVEMLPKRPVRTWRERFEGGVTAFAVFTIVVALMTAIMAMTFFATQRPIDGM
jgi:peptidoglycan/LPS O-acetylase OafA/YrhL